MHACECSCETLSVTVTVMSGVPAQSVVAPHSVGFTSRTDDARLE